MEEQMSDLRSHIRRWLTLLPILCGMLACSFLSRSEVATAPVAQGPAGEATANIAAPQGSTNEVAENVPDGLDPLDRVLELRSIRFQLTALQPDGSARSVQAQIDNAGSMYLKFHSPDPGLSDIPENFDPDLKLPEDSEVYVVDGKAYQPDDQNPAWMTAPVADDYMKELSDLLHGPNGPGLWLDLLPAGSLTPAGQETVGGFIADKYTVNGTVHDQTITGSLWYESHTLVQVELHIPAALFDPDTLAAQGERKITLEVQKTAVPPVMLPTLPAAEATSQP